MNQPLVMNPKYDPAAPVVQQQLLQLAPDALELLDQVSNRFDAVVPQGVSPEDVLKPAFWAHHAVKFQPMNEIRARCVDGTWVGYYLVTDCSRTWARLHPLSVHRLSTSDVSESQAESLEKMKVVYEAHKIVHRGPHKWSVVRKIDSAVLVQDLEQKDAAQTWLDAYARKETSGASIPVAPVATASS